jgi:hypothetical protein
MLSSNADAYSQQQQALETGGIQSPIPFIQIEQDVADKIYNKTEFRFKLHVRHVGDIDVVRSQVNMRFRLTVFWNENIMQNHDLPQKDLQLSMKGRRIALLPDGDIPLPVPQVALQRCSEIEITNDPEVKLLNKDGRRLLRWTCEYRANVGQDIDVDNFPYDLYDIVLSVGISVYDSLDRVWSEEEVVFGAATDEDNERKNKDPGGGIDHKIAIPGFLRTIKNFGGSPEKHPSMRLLIGTKCMRYKFQVRRDHTYYNQNILCPLLVLHCVAIASLALPIEDFGGRASLLLAVAFLEIGIRLSLDGRLPEVAYSILLQRMINLLFFLLLFLTIESGILYFVFVRVLNICTEHPVEEASCRELDGWRIATWAIDGVSAFLSFLPIPWILVKKMWPADQERIAWEKKD